MIRNTLRFCSKRSLSYTQSRFTASTAAEISIEPPKRGKEKKIIPIVQKDVLKHFRHPDREIALEYPPTILVKSKKKIEGGLYIADKYAVDPIFDEVTKDLPPDKPIFEINPGLGLLTERLIKETKNLLVLCEPDKICFEKMRVSFINNFK
jgi:hypothetical protein